MNGSLSIDTFDEHLPSFDIIFLILPLNAESKHFMNQHRLALMKDRSVLVNVARGGVVDTDALVKELNSGRIYAALDVTDPEPLPHDHPLWKAKNTLISPHVAVTLKHLKNEENDLLKNNCSELLLASNPSILLILTSYESSSFARQLLLHQELLNSANH